MMTWEQKYNRLRAGVRDVLLGLQVATRGVNPKRDLLTMDVFATVRRLEDLLPEEAHPHHVEPEKAEQLELPLVPRSVSEAQGL